MDNQILKAVIPGAVRFAEGMLRAAWVVAARVILWVLIALPIGAAVWVASRDVTVARVAVFIAAYALCALDRAQWPVLSADAGLAEFVGETIGVVIGLATGVWIGYWLYWLLFPLAAGIASCIHGA